MSELHKHISPIRKREKDFKKTFKSLNGALEIIYHSLVPHKQPKEAEKAIDETYFTIKGIDETYYSASLEMYKESKERIKQLEEKAFKLLTYISALSAILFFFLGKEIEGITKVLVIVSIGILVVALIISLRCVGTKSQKAFFINAIFNFDEKNIVSKSQNKIAAELMNCAVFNQGVADNTADILKASRYTLSIGIITTVIALVLFTTNDTPSSSKELQTINVQFSDTTIVDTLNARIDEHKNELKEVNKRLKQLNTTLKEYNIQLDSVNGQRTTKPKLW